MKITGTVENIIFRNDENMYTVLELDHEDTPVVATGIFPTLCEGETVELEGEFKDSKYGEQFVATSFKSIGFQNKEAIARYLAGGLFKGVGEATANSIVKKFGVDTFDVIEKAPEKLAQIRGISLKKASDIANSYKDIFGMREAVIYLAEKGLSFNLALKIFNVYKNHTISMVKKNPYGLVEDIEGIGFKTADEIAKKIGVEINSDFRMRAGFLYVLKDNQTSEGSTAIPFDELLSRANVCLNIPTSELKDKLEKVLADLKLEGKCKEFMLAEVRYVTLAASYFLERNLANLLCDISENAKEVFTGGEKDVEEFEKDNHISLHEKQKDAVLRATKSGLTIITGGPGTGKTTIIKCIIHIFKKLKYKIALVAPTGRAAKRLSESTGEEAKTIHRLLDLDFKNGKGMFLYNESTRLEEDLIIVDEVSMTDVYVMKSLLNAVKYGARVILVGDKDQLPSVGAGNVLKDILEADMFETVFLTEVYRQGKESLIITNAHKINGGQMPDLSQKNSDFFYSNLSNGEEMLKRIIEMVTATIPKFSHVPSKEIQILAPMKKGVVGVENLNKALQNGVNPSAKNKAEITVNMSTFRVGDKVMQTVNNYQMEWVKEKGNDLEFGTGVFNGDIGEIVDIVPKTLEVKVLFEDGRNVDYEREDLNDLVLAYAISVHKSQGSEFDVVIMPITWGAPSLFTRNLLYTGITRAKKMLVLMGSVNSINNMVKNNYIEKRYTMLKGFLTKDIN